MKEPDMLQECDDGKLDEDQLSLLLKFENKFVAAVNDMAHHFTMQQCVYSLLTCVTRICVVHGQEKNDFLSWIEQCLSHLYDVESTRDKPKH